MLTHIHIQPARTFKCEYFIRLVAEQQRTFTRNEEEIFQLIANDLAMTLELFK